MTRYQCPFCPSFHRTEDTKPCSTHTLGFSPNCAGCAQALQAIQALCGGGQS